MLRKNQSESGLKGPRRPKPRIRSKYWYVLDATNFLKPKTIKNRFLSEKAARLFIQRRFSSDFKHYRAIKGSELKRFKLEFAKLKIKFYSKYAIPDRKVLTRQGQKTFRTTIRRKLFGYMRVMPYSHRCDSCKKSKPYNPQFATKRNYLIYGRVRRICDNCAEKYEEKHELIPVPNY